jgi:tetratricopeptide (TPR) repeat protein
MFIGSRLCYGWRVASLISTLAGLLLATNQADAASNVLANHAGVAVAIAATNNATELEYLRLLALDNAAQAEVDRWLTDEAKFAKEGAGGDSATMRGKVRQRLEPVEKAYKEFLDRNPGHTRARLAFGSFLNDVGREDDAKLQWEKARELDPKNPAVWNNLANYHGHNGPTTNAFACYEKAIELAPNESVYYQNLATTVYLFRRDATNFYGISEQQVFDKAMALYRKALSLDPENFPLATDLAQTYYGIKPPRVKEALAAWNDAAKIARDDIEREGVRLHLARWYRTAGDLAAARRELTVVTNEMYTTTKSNILRALDKPDGPTNSSPKSISTDRPLPK